MQRLAIILMLAFMLGGCTVPCYHLSDTEGEVFCENQFISCDVEEGWQDAPPPAGMSCKP
jgi:hypothetical protein